MRLEILDQAERDLVEGFRFYEDQGEGLGSYFLNNLTLTSTLYISRPAFTENLTNTITACYPDAFLSPFFTQFRKRGFSSMRSLIVGAIPLGSENNSSNSEAAVW